MSASASLAPSLAAASGPEQSNLPAGTTAALVPVPMSSKGAPRGMGYKVFVGGLPLHATNSSIMTFFSVFGKVICAWQQKTSPKKHRTMSSTKERGFGFVCFADKEAAQRAIGEHEMNGRIIEAKPAVAEARDGSKVEGSRAENRVTSAPLKVFVRWSAKNFKDVPEGVARVGYESDTDLLEAVTPVCEGVVDASILFERDSGVKKECGFLTFDTPSNAKAALSKTTIQIPGRFSLWTTPAFAGVEKQPVPFAPTTRRDSSIITAPSLKPTRRTKSAVRRSRRGVPSDDNALTHCGEGAQFSRSGNPFIYDDAHWISGAHAQQSWHYASQGCAWPCTAYPTCVDCPNAYPSAWAQMMLQQQSMAEYKYHCAMSNMMSGCAINGYGSNAPCSYGYYPYNYNQGAYGCNAPCCNQGSCGYSPMQDGYGSVPCSYNQGAYGYNTIQNSNGQSESDDERAGSDLGDSAGATCAPVQDKNRNENDTSDERASMASRHNTVLKEMADSSDEHFPASDESDDVSGGEGPDASELKSDDATAPVRRISELQPHLFIRNKAVDAPADVELGCESYTSSISDASSVDDVAAGHAASSVDDVAAGHAASSVDDVAAGHAVEVEEAPVDASHVAEEPEDGKAEKTRPKPKYFMPPMSRKNRRRQRQGDTQA